MKEVETMTRPLQEYLDGYYETKLERKELPTGETAFVAWLVQLPRCLAQASSPTGALTRLDQVRRHLFEDRAKRGMPIPEPDVLINPVINTFAVSPLNILNETSADERDCAFV